MEQTTFRQTRPQTEVVIKPEAGSGKRHDTCLVEYPFTACWDYRCFFLLLFPTPIGRLFPRMQQAEKNTLGGEGWLVDIPLVYDGKG